MPTIKEQIKKNIDKTNRIKNNDDNAEFKSTHNLPFEVAQYIMPDVLAYRVGTCTGIYSWDAKNYIIIGITNHEQNNGHLDDVFEWFENSCKRDKKNLMVAEIMNRRFMKHLIEKRGFTVLDEDNVIKYII